MVCDGLIRVTTSAYDPKNQQTLAIDPQSKRTTVTFDGLGRKTQIQYGNGAVASYTFNEAGWISKIVNITADGTSTLTYAYDKSGHRTRQTEGDGTVTTWTYDAIYQLTREQ